MADDGIKRGCSASSTALPSSTVQRPVSCSSACFQGNYLAAHCKPKRLAFFFLFFFLNRFHSSARNRQKMPETDCTSPWAVFMQTRKWVWLKKPVMFRQGCSIVSVKARAVFSPQASRHHEVSSAYCVSPKIGIPPGGLPNSPQNHPERGSLLWDKPTESQCMQGSGYFYRARRTGQPSCKPSGLPLSSAHCHVPPGKLTEVSSLCHSFGCGSKNRCQNGTLASGHMGQNPGNPSCLILSQPHLA